jgi:hypothetical protein
LANSLAVQVLREELGEELGVEAKEAQSQAHKGEAMGVPLVRHVMSLI